MWCASPRLALSRAAFVSLCLTSSACQTSVPTPVDTDVPPDTDAPVETDVVPPDDTEVPDDTDGDTDPSPPVVTPGATCDVTERIGSIQVTGWGGPLSVQATVYDAPSPWLDVPAATTSTCAHHAFNPASCGTCAPGETCSITGDCVPERRTHKDLALTLTAGAEVQTLTADPITGIVSDALTAGDGSTPITVDVRWGDQHIVFDPMPAGSGELTATVDIEGDSMRPGALTATWTPLSDGSHVGSLIPINHHAAGPTFTDCIAPASAGSFSATADMIDPLAVSTGLEFQGLDHLFIAAAQTSEGCVELRMGQRVLVFPE